MVLSGGNEHLASEEAPGQAKTGLCLRSSGKTRWNEETRGGMGTEEEGGTIFANALHTHTHT